MMEPAARRQPSDNPEELQAQLLRELERLGDGRAEEPELFRAYVQHTQVLAWRGVADGRMRAPREALECLRAAQPFVDRNMPDLKPAAAAATEIYIFTQSLSLAAEALAERRAEERLSDDRSATERAILRILAENRGAYLRRGEIHERLSEEHRPTPPRVGQILAELHEEGIVMRIHGRAQGNPNAAFYALAPRGVELCRNLELIEAKPDAKPPGYRVDWGAHHGPCDKEEPVLEPAPASPPLLEQALSTLVDPAVPPDWRSILAGLIGSLDPSPDIRKRLQYWASRSATDQDTDKLLGTIYAVWDCRGSSFATPEQSSGSSEMLKVLINTAVITCQAWTSNYQTP